MQKYFICLLILLFKYILQKYATVAKDIKHFVKQNYRLQRISKHHKNFNTLLKFFVSANKAKTRK